MWAMVALLFSPSKVPLTVSFGSGESGGGGAGAGDGGFHRGVEGYGSQTGFESLGTLRQGADCEC